MTRRARPAPRLPSLGPDGSMREASGAIAPGHAMAHAKSLIVTDQPAAREA